MAEELWLSPPSPAQPFGERLGFVARCPILGDEVLVSALAQVMRKRVWRGSALLVLRIRRCDPFLFCDLLWKNPDGLTWVSAFPHCRIRRNPPAL